MINTRDFFIVLLSPSSASVLSRKHSLKESLPNVLLACIISSLVIAGVGFILLAASGKPSLTNEEWVALQNPLLIAGLVLGLFIHYLLSFYAYTAIIYLLAKLLGGTGDFSSQTYVLSIVEMARALFLSLVLLPFPLKYIDSIKDAVSSVLCVIILIVLIYMLALTYRAIKDTHKLSQKNTVIVMILSLLLSEAVRVILTAVGL